MTSTDKADKALSDLTGACLCGGVQYQIHGPRRNIINCHCENCRRTHGHIAAYTLVKKADITMLAQQSLSWYHDKSPNTYRGFCRNCGASLFWDSRDASEKIAISAGSLDTTEGLKTIGHIYVAEAGDYYEISDDLPEYSHSSHGLLK